MSVEKFKTTALRKSNLPKDRADFIYVSRNLASKIFFGTTCPKKKMRSILLPPVFELDTTQLPGMTRLSVTVRK